MLAGWLTSLGALAVPVLGDLQAVDTSTGVTIGFAIPEVDEPPFDIIVSVFAPVDAGWVGVAWGGSIPGSPLSVVWSNGESAVVDSWSAK